MYIFFLRWLIYRVSWTYHFIFQKFLIIKKIVLFPHLYHVYRPKCCFLGLSIKMEANAKLGMAGTSRSFTSTINCKYPYRQCSRQCMDGYNYCQMHILEDKSAPFRQCWSVSKTGRRCWNAAPLTNRRDR